MENMKAKIVILNYMKYTKKDKETKSETPLTRIEFVINDFKEGNSYCGTAPISCFYKGHDIYKKLSKGLLLRPLDAEFEIKEDLYDTMSLRKMLKKINDIDLY